jgi:hypothetical protein
VVSFPQVSPPKASIHPSSPHMSYTPSHLILDTIAQII